MIKCYNEGMELALFFTAVYFMAIVVGKAIDLLVELQQKGVEEMERYMRQSEKREGKAHAKDCNCHLRSPSTFMFTAYLKNSERKYIEKEPFLFSLN